MNCVRRIINCEKEYKRALAAIEKLWESKPGTEEHDALEVLSLLVEDYETRTVPISRRARISISKRQVFPSSSRTCPCQRKELERMSLNVHRMGRP